MLSKFALRSNLHNSTRLLQTTRKMHIESIPMRWGRGDNYAYVVTDEATKASLVIDPAEPDEYALLHIETETTRR